MGYDQTDAEYDAEVAKARRPRQGSQPGETLGGREARLWKAAETLDNALDTLADRMHPVLLPERAAAALSGVGDDSPERSDLGGFLDELTTKLDRLGRRAADLSERVDL